MNKYGNRIILASVGLTLFIAAGCNLDPRTTNQGGGTLISAGSKAAGGNLSTLNPDEWQILLDNAPSLASQFGVDLGNISIPTLTDDQAQQLTNCINDAGITSFNALENLNNFNIASCKSLASLF